MIIIIPQLFFIFQDVHSHQLADHLYFSMCIQDRDEAINVVKESFDQWRTKLNEIWNVAGILSSGNYTNYPGVSYTTDDTAEPYITSHYGYYMSSWHIILGIPVYTM